MKRRGFFSALAGLCLGALGVTAKSPPPVNYVVGVDVAAKGQEGTAGFDCDLPPGIWRNYSASYSDGVSKDDFDARMERVMREYRNEPPLKEAVT